MQKVITYKQKIVFLISIEKYNKTKTAERFQVHLTDKIGQIYQKINLYSNCSHAEKTLLDDEIKWSLRKEIEMLKETQESSLKDMCKNLQNQIDTFKVENTNFKIRCKSCLIKINPVKSRTLK